MENNILEKIVIKKKAISNLSDYQASRLFGGGYSDNCWGTGPSGPTQLCASVVLTWCETCNTCKTCITCVGGGGPTDSGGHTCDGDPYTCTVTTCNGCR